MNKIERMGTAEKVALYAVFAIYSLGVANAILNDLRAPEPGTNIERPDSPIIDRGPGCDIIPWTAPATEDGAGVRVIACA